jgi:hypothetical protein
VSDLSRLFGKKLFVNLHKVFRTEIVELVQIAQITRAWAVGARAKKKPLARKQGVLGGFSLPPNS